MDRGPLMVILKEMEGTDKELNLTLIGADEPLELRNVVKADPLVSANGIRVTTRQNFIWLDATHVSAAWQVRTEL